MSRNPSISSSPTLPVVPPLSLRPQQRQFWPPFSSCSPHPLGLRFNVMFSMPLPKNSGLNRDERKGVEFPEFASALMGLDKLLSHLWTAMPKWVNLVSMQEKEQLAAVREALWEREICHYLLTSGGKWLTGAGIFGYGEVWGILSASEGKQPRWQSFSPRLHCKGP